jgi:hypothetical protein
LKSGPNSAHYSSHVHHDVTIHQNTTRTWNPPATKQMALLCCDALPGKRIKEISNLDGTLVRKLEKKLDKIGLNLDFSK